MSRREDERHKSEVRECIKIVEERLDGRANPDREVVYYSNPSKGGFPKRRKPDPGADLPISEEDEPADARLGSRSASKGQERYGRAPATSAGKEYARPDRSPASATKIARESEMAARSEYYQQKKIENLRKLQRELDLEAKHGGPVPPKKAPAKPAKAGRQGSAEAQPLRKSVDARREPDRAPFAPQINPNNSLHRTNDDRLAWLKDKEERASNKRVLDNSFEDFSYQPKINSKSRDIASKPKDASDNKRKTKDQFVKDFLEKEKKTMGKPRTGDAPPETKNKLPLKSSRQDHSQKKTDAYQGPREVAAAQRKPQPQKRETSTGGRSANAPSKSRDPTKANNNGSKRQVEFESPPLKRSETQIVEDFRATGSSKAKARNGSKSVQRAALGPSTGDRDSAQQRGSKDRAAQAPPNGILKSSSFKEKEAKGSSVSQTGIPIKSQPKNGKKPPAEEKTALPDRPAPRADGFLRQSTEKSQRGATPPTKAPGKPKTPSKQPATRSKSRDSSGKKDSSHKNKINRLKLQNEEAREKKLTNLIYKDRIAPSHASPAKNHKH